MTEEETVTPTVVLTTQPNPSVATAILGKVLQTDGNGLQTVMLLYENRHVRLKANQGWVPLKRRERETALNERGKRKDLGRKEKGKIFVTRHRPRRKKAGSDKSRKKNGFGSEQTKNIGGFETEVAFTAVSETRDRVLVSGFFNSRGNEAKRRRFRKISRLT